MCIHTLWYVESGAGVRCTAVGEGEPSCVFLSVGLFGMGIAYTVQFASTVHCCAYEYYHTVSVSLSTIPQCVASVALFNSGTSHFAYCNWCL